jgi:hypothetical protein
MIARAIVLPPIRRSLELVAGYLLAGAAIAAARLGLYRRDGQSRMVWIPAWRRSPHMVSIRRRTGYSWASVIAYVGSTGREFRCRALRLR